MCLCFFNSDQRCGYSDSPFARIHYFHTEGSRNGFEGMEPVCIRTMDLREWNRCVSEHKNTLTLYKTYFFLIQVENYLEDVRQDEKHVPDLLESILRPTGPVKEKSRQKLFKRIQCVSKIKKIRVCTFQMSGKIPDSTQAVISSCDQVGC